MTEHFYAAIMAGGGGTRLWPLSRRRRPKQYLRLFGDRTLFQIAVDRIAPLIDYGRMLVLTVEAQAEELHRQRPQIPLENFIIEPEARGTAAAIGLAAIHLRKRDGQAVMACLTADHVMRDEEGFRSALKAAQEAALAGKLVTLGIPPTGPDTGYGYIERGPIWREIDGFACFHLARFTEKPDLETAEAYLKSGGYDWNSGMFVWTAERILDEFERQMPALFEGLRRIEPRIGMADEQEAVEMVWKGLEPTTIDYGVMEGARDAVVIPVGDIGWLDVGDWGRLFEALEADESGNVARAAMSVAIDAGGNLVWGEETPDSPRLIALLGVDDLVIIDTKDALLVCRREEAERVKALVQWLRDQGLDDYL